MSIDDSRDQRYVSPLPPATEPIVPGQEDVENGQVRERVTVPYRIHPRDRSLYL